MTKRRDVLKGIGSGAAVITMGGVGVASADDDEGDGEAGLRVAHASPDAPDVDVLVEGEAVIEDLSFRSVTDYLEVPADEYEIEVQTSESEETVFGPADVDLEAEDYTAVARGEVTEDADTDFTVSIFEDTNGANIDDDEARVRAIHASPDAPPVDVTVNDAAATLFEDVKFGESSGYTVVDAVDENGDRIEYDVEIRANGSEKFQVDNVTFEGGSTYTAFAVGYLDPENAPSDEEFGLVAVQDKSAPPRGDEDDDDDEEDEDDDGNGDDNGRGRGRGNE